MSGGKVLLLNPPADRLGDELSTRHHCLCSVFCQDFVNYQWLQSGLQYAKRLEFGDWPPPQPAAFQHIIVFQPREKSLLRQTLAKLEPLCKTGASIWLVG